MSDDLFLGFLQGAEVPGHRQQRLWLTDEDRKTGLHVIGAPNTGKSKFLEHLIRQDISAGHGLCLIDPHGELYESILEWCAYFRPNREIIPINFSRGEYVIGFNPFQRGPGDVAVQVERRIAATVKAWGAANTDESPRLEHWLRQLYYALIESDDLTLLESQHFITYTAGAVRKYLVSRIGDPGIRAHWDELSASRTVEGFTTQLESTRNRLSRFLSSAPARRFFALTDPGRNLDLASVMDRSAIVLVNLKWSDEVTQMNARLFGALLVNEFIASALRRDVGPGRTPRPFYLYLDEFQNFVTQDIGEAVPQTRKFGLRFVLAHQLLKHLRDPDADVLDEVMTAVRARAVFGGLQEKDALDLVGDLFPGQIDYTEVKYVDTSVKFWPVYTRDKVYSRGTSDVETWGDSIGDAISGSSGLSIPDGSSGFFFDTPAGVRFDSSGWGSVDSHSTGGAHGTTESVADIPLFYPVPYIEETPHHYTLEEQRKRLADTLKLQLQRHCFVRPPAGNARPLLVPFVERFPLPEHRVREYELEMARKAGALGPEEVDAIINTRRERIELQAKEFVSTLPSPLHSTANAKREPATKQPKPTQRLNPAGRKKPPEGTDGTEG